LICRKLGHVIGAGQRETGKDEKGRVSCASDEQLLVMDTGALDRGVGASCYYILGERKRWKGKRSGSGPWSVRGRKEVKTGSPRSRKVEQEETVPNTLSEVQFFTREGGSKRKKREGGGSKPLGGGGGGGWGGVLIKRVNEGGTQSFCGSKEGKKRSCGWDIVRAGRKGARRKEPKTL